MRSQVGYMPIFRKIESSWIWKDSDHFKIWYWLLSHAQYDSSSKIFWKEKVRVLQRGQILTTEREIAAATGVNRAKVQRFIKKLKIDPMIELESEPQGSIITILNYDKYNPTIEKSEPQSEPSFEPRPSHDRAYNRLLTNKERKELSTVREISPFSLDLGTRWLAFGLELYPAYSKKWTVELFGLAIDEVMRKADLTPEKMEEVFCFVQNDSFWKQQARSPAGLLKKSERNGLRKIDNIIARIPKREKTFEELLHERDLKRSSVSQLA